MVKEAKATKTEKNRYLRLFLTGFGMGTADVIPGVSGGTIAFLAGIYQELLYSIKVATGEFLKLLLQGKLKKAFAILPFRFLLPLAVGLFAAIFTLAELLSYLLETQPVFVWSFFFGLVLASIFVVLKRVGVWKVSYKVSFLIAAIITYFIVGAIPVETPNTLFFFFISGMIAISAMILPGISGSFILLLLGKYQQVLAAVTERDFVTLGVFMLGCIVGIALFARFLSWLFKHYHDISIAILAGIMLGSLQKIWPWKETVLTRINSHGVEVPLVENNVLPSALDAAFFIALFLGILGAFIVFQLDRMHLTKEHTSDIADPSFKKELA